jgi:hypothetical protein
VFLKVLQGWLLRTLLALVNPEEAVCGIYGNAV